MQAGKLRINTCEKNNTIVLRRILMLITVILLIADYYLEIIIGMEG